MSRRRWYVPFLIAGALAAPALALGEDGPGTSGASAGTGLPTVDLRARVPARWLREEHDDLPIQSPRLLRTLPRECRTRRGYREHCQGERRVPAPTGDAAALVARLALNERATAMVLRMGHAFPEWLDAARGTDTRAELDFPVPSGHVGRGFGRVRQDELRHRRHFGVDIGAEEGTPIVAARGGLVVYSDDGLTGFGNALMVLHEDDTSTFYAHCHRTLVAAGERIARGQPIAEVGMTGFAQAPHLHFEVRLRGWARDPLTFMRPPHGTLER